MELAARLALDRGRAAEEEVAAPPAHQVVPELGEPVGLGRVGASFDVDVLVVDVQPWGAIASSTGSPWRTTFTTACMIAPRSRSDPALPTTSLGPPGADTSDGAIMLVSRRPTARASPVTLRSNSPSMLLSWMPCPDTITPDPEPVEIVSAAAFPCWSTAEMCVVPRWRAAPAGRAAPIRASAARSSPRRRAAAEPAAVERGRDAGRARARAARA